MNIRRICVFAVLEFLATALAAFPLGVIKGMCRASGEPVPTWVLPLQGLAVPFAAMMVFLFMGYVQRHQPFRHGLIVALLVWAVSMPINVLGFGQPLWQWAVGIVLMVPICLIGIGLGIVLCKVVGAQPPDTRQPQHDAAQDGESADATSPPVT